MLNIGIVGFGFMGRMHYRCWDAMEGAKVAAVCDANEKVLEQLGESTGNIEGAGTNIDLSSFNFYTDFDEMLSKEALDAVCITLPTNLHPDFSAKALKAGVNVLCEKPMALTIDECESMVAAAKESSKVLMIGHCLRFWPEYVKAKEIIESGKYGKVVGAVFQRLGAADHTTYDPSDFGYVTHEGEGYAIRGGNHLAGTHIMGTSSNTSVVNSEQRSWDHENLYLVGGGSMPTIGTANVTPTIAALCFRSAQAMLGQLS